MLWEYTDFINGAITAPSKNVDDDRTFKPTFKTTFKSFVYFVQDLYLPSRENLRWLKTQKPKTH